MSNYKANMHPDSTWGSLQRILGWISGGLLWGRGKYKGKGRKTQERKGYKERLSSSKNTLN